MRILTKANLVQFGEKHPDAVQPLLAWYDEAKKATWKTPQDIKDIYRHASIINQSRVVFNIKGNSYRLVVSVAYKAGIIFIKFIGTHAEYDKIDVATIEP